MLIYSVLIFFHPINNSPSFLKLIEEDDPIFLLYKKKWGPSSFFLSVFKSFVHQNCFISKITPDEYVIVMTDEFWGQFYGKNFKGGQSTLYLGDRFWNIKMDGLTNSCVFTHGCSEMVNDLALDMQSTFVFAMAGYKTDVTIYCKRFPINP
ncbi:hypothetical protein Hanom_Chr03g00216231 [Helianthus anomalus]